MKVSIVQAVQSFDKLRMTGKNNPLMVSLSNHALRSTV